MLTFLKRMLASRVLTVLNLKGGVGKTHTTWLLAAVCQEQQKRILLVDCDTQGNLSGSFGQRNATQAIEALFDPAAELNASAIVRHTEFSHIDLIPAGMTLAKFDLSDQRVWERADLQFSLVDPMAELRATYDLIVFDCPPRLSLVSFAALCAAEHVIIPMEAADWGAHGIVQVTAAINHVKQRFNSRLNLLGYLVSRFKTARSYQQSYLKQLREHFGPLAFDTVIPDLAKFEQSVTDRIPITLHAPRSREAGIARCFLDEVERRAESFERSRNRGRESGIRPGTVAAVSA